MRGTGEEVGLGNSRGGAVVVDNEGAEGVERPDADGGGGGEGMGEGRGVMGRESWSCLCGSVSGDI